MTALREIREETGLLPGQLIVEHNLGSYADNTFADEHKEVFIYQIRLLGNNFPELRPDSEHVEAKWVSIGDAIRLVANTNQKYFISKFEKAKITQNNA